VIALTPSGKLSTRYVEHASGATAILVALRPFQRCIARPMIVRWGRLTAQRATIGHDYVAAHPGLAVEWRPPYAPALKPEEGGHGKIKQHLRHAAPATPHDLRVQVDRGFARVRRGPDLILGVFRQAGLPVHQLS
jgi:hypothetical protein